MVFESYARTHNIIGNNIFRIEVVFFSPSMLPFLDYDYELHCLYNSQIAFYGKRAECGFFLLFFSAIRCCSAFKF